MLKWLSYVTLVGIIIIPVALLDGAIGHIDSAGAQFMLRIVFLFLAFQITRFIPMPS